MKMKTCDYCGGSGKDPNGETEFCYICDATGTIPDEPVSHCQACGEPVELGLEWCARHRPAADLWQAAQQEQDPLCPTCYGDRMVESETGYVDCPSCDGSGYRI